MKLNLLTAMAALALSASVSAETYQCFFKGSYSGRVETFTRSNDGFLMQIQQEEKVWPVSVVRETPTAIFLLEDFQHPPNRGSDDTGSFLLRIIDKQSLTFIWDTHQFTSELHHLHYRGNCILT